jgi:DNA primase
MEGQMDVLHAHQAGFASAIGISGTALSSEHLSLMKRYSENLMLCLDADRAGLAATQKHALAALAAGMRVKAVRLPEGKDPADLIKEDPKEFTKRVAEAGTIVEFFLAVLSEKETDQHKLVIATERIVLPLVAAIQSSVEREHFVGVVARAIASTPEAVRAALPKISSAAPSGPVPAPRPAPLTAVDPIVQLRAIVEAYPESLIAKRVEDEYTRVVGSAMTPEASPEKVLFETGILYGEAPDEHAADDALRHFEKSYLAGAYNRALQELRNAQMSRDTDRVNAAEAECVRLMKALALL